MSIDRACASPAMCSAELDVLELELEAIEDRLLYESMGGQLDVSMLSLIGTDFDPVNSLLLM